MYCSCTVAVTWLLCSLFFHEGALQGPPSPAPFPHLPAVMSEATSKGSCHTSAEARATSMNCGNVSYVLPLNTHGTLCMHRLEEGGQHTSHEEMKILFHSQSCGENGFLLDMLKFISLICYNKSNQIDTSLGFIFLKALIWSTMH